jgi:WD40 repeat protein
MKVWVIILPFCFLYVHIPVRGTAVGPHMKDTVGEITVVRIDSTGHRLLIGYDYGSLELWQLRADSNKLLWQNPGFPAGVQALYFVGEINQVLAVYKQGGIVFFDAGTGSVSKVFFIDFDEYIAREPERLSESDYNEGHHVLAVSGNVSDRVVLIDVLKLFASKKNSKDSMYVVNTNSWTRVFPDPLKTSLVYEIRSDRKRDSAVVKDLSSNIESFANKDEIVTCLKVEPGFRYVIAGTKAGKLIKWDLEDSSETIEPERIVSVVPSKDHGEFNDILGLDCRDSLMLSVCFYSSTCGQMQWWDSRDVTLIDFVKDADPSTCRRIRINSDAMYLITTGDFSYRVWKFNSHSGMYELQCDLAYANSVGYGKKVSCVDIWNNQLLAVGDQKNVFFFNLADHKRLANLRRTMDTLRIYERAAN